MGISGSIKYINQVFNDYLEYSHLTCSDLKGRIILEIGPGDNFGVALKFLVHGAKKVISLDKFYSDRDQTQQCRIYRELRNTLTHPQLKIFDSLLRIHDDRFEIISDKFEYVYSRGIEEAIHLFQSPYFDIIVSRAVLEHVADVPKAIHVMDELLKEQGIMIHNIDFRDHGMFSGAGMHPLTFLTIPKVIWKCMTIHSGKPNRILIDYYRKELSKMKYEFEITPSFIYEKDNSKIPSSHIAKLRETAILLLGEIHSKLQPQFIKMQNDDLMISSAFIMAKKTCR